MTMSFDDLLTKLNSHFYIIPDDDVIFISATEGVTEVSHITSPIAKIEDINDFLDDLQVFTSETEPIPNSLDHILPDTIISESVDDTPAVRFLNIFLPT